MIPFNIKKWIYNKWLITQLIYTVIVFGPMILPFQVDPNFILSGRLTVVQTMLMMNIGE